MGIKKKSKISAEFNMSSMTDIIFLLLIFFMLTSSIVQPNALNLKLPGSGNPTVSSDSPPDIAIRKNGKFQLDGRAMSFGNIEIAVKRLKRATKGKKLDITISPQKGTPVEHVVRVMDLAMRLNINGILTTEPD